MSVTFNDRSLGNPTSWQWTFPGGTPSISTQQNPTVTYNTQGQYNVTLTAKNASGTTQTLTQQNYVSVQSKATADFIFIVSGNTVKFQNISTNNTNAKYLWEFGDSTLSNQITPNHLFTQAGTYPVKLTVTNSCGTSTIQKNVIIRTTGINESDNSFKFKIHPNPNNGKFDLQLSDVFNTEGVIEIIDLTGKIQYTENISDLNNAKYSLNLHNLMNGIYFLKVNFGSKYVIEKLIIQN